MWSKLYSATIYTLTLSLTLTIQNKYKKDFSTPIPDIFPMYLIKNLVGKNWQMENSLLINFIQDINDLMTRGFLLVIFFFFHVTLEVMKHFLGFILDFYTQIWKILFPPSFIKSVGNYSNTCVCIFNKKHNVSINNLKKTWQFLSIRWSVYIYQIMKFFFVLLVNAGHIEWKQIH